MKRLLLLLASALLCPVIGAYAQTVTATLTASSQNYSTSGGTLTLTAGIDYTGSATPTALGFKITLPTGWTLAANDDLSARIGGTNVPPTAPAAGTGPVLEFAYTSFPANKVSFVVVVQYPASLTGTQTINASAIYRTPLVEPVAAPINITSAADAAPAFTTNPVSQNAVFGQSLTLTSVATGNPAPTFQWRKNTNDIPGAIGPNYTIASVTSSSAGSYDVVATNSLDVATSTAATLTFVKADQTITFGALAAKTFGDAAFALTATASSGLAVSYTSSDSSVATVSGSTVTIVGAGSTTITASQAGNSNFNAATSVPQTLTVNKANQTITFGALAAKTFGDPTFNLSATASSGLTVSYASSNTSVATVSGNTVTIVGGGTTNITASQAGSANYNAATDVIQPLTVNKALAGVALSGLGATYDGNPHSVTATTTPSGLNVTITYAGSSTAPTNVGSYAIVATVVENNYSGSATGTLVIAKANQTITFGALAGKTFGDAPFALGATASSGLTVSYASSNTSVATISGNTVTIVGAGNANITASQAGNANYNAATDVVQPLTVSKATATVTLGSLGATYDGAPHAATAVTNPVGLTVNFTYDGSGTAPTNAGSYAVVGTINNANYTGSASDTLVIAKANQAITFGALAAKAFGDPAFALTATASSGLAVTYTSSDTNVATVSGSTVTIVGAGSTTITAAQAGNVNYNAAADVPQTLTVNKANQTITFGALAAKTYGDPTFNLGATASSGLTVSYVSSNTGVATVSGNTVTIVGAGTTNITASQAGNTNYNAASNVVQSLTVNKAVAAVVLSGLSATYDANPHPVTATTTPGGLNVTITYAGSSTAPTNVGSYAIVATVVESNYSGGATGALVIAKANQTITFDPLPSKTFGDAPFTISATSSSGLAVTFTSSDPTAATVSGNTVTILTGGTPTITASQAGDANYNAATPVGRTLTIAKALATVTLTDLTHTYNGFVKGAGGITNPPGLGLSFTYTGTGSPTTAPTNAGSYGVTATIGDPRYQGSATGTITINKADQTITFAALPSKPLDAGAFSYVATASSGLPVSFATANPSSGTVLTLNGSAVTLVNTGTIDIIASQAGDSNWNAAPSVTRNQTVLNQSQTLTFAGTELTGKTFGNAPFTIAGSSNRGLLITFTSSNPNVATVGTGTLSGNNTTATVTIVGAGTATITATQAGDSNTAAADPIPRTLTVAKAAATITLGSLSQTYDGTPKSATATTTPTGLNVAFTYTPTGGSPSSTPPTNAGSYAVNATISGSTPPESNYTGTASGTLVIAKATQTIVFQSMGSPRLIGSSPFAITANATSSLTTAFESSNTSVATVTNNAAGPGAGTVTIVGLGSTVITARQAGDSNYLPAPDVSQTLVVNPVAPVIVSTPPLAQTAVVGNGFVFGPITLNALSAPVTFSMSTPAGLGGLSVDPVSGNISGIPSGTPGSYSIVLTATNATGADSKTIALTLNPPAPVITSAASVSVQAGSPISYTLTATPATGVTFAATNLPAWLAFNTSTGAFTGTPSTVGTVTVQLTATNTTGTATLPLVISITANPNAPVYSGTLNPTGTAGTAFTFTPNFSAGTGTTTFALSGTIPSGLVISSTTGVLSWPTPLVGSFPVTVSATRGGVTAPVDLVITINPAPTAPVITSASTAAGTAGALFTFNLTSSPTATTYSVVDAGGTIALGASGLSLNTSSGAITGTLPKAPGTVKLSASGTNAAGTGASSLLVITVNQSATAPVITSAVIVQGQVGVPLTYTLTSTVGVGGATTTGVTYGVTGPLPPGLSPSGSTITGTPTTAGSYENIFVAGTDTNGFTGLAIEIIFNIAPAANVPAVNSNGTASGQVGQQFTYAITGTNSPTSFAAAGLPANGLSVNAAGVISGIPSAATPSGSPMNITLTATNGAGTSAPKTLLITIAPAPATPVITSATSASGQVGSAFSFTITASQSPTSFVATGLPAGLTLNSATGAFGGTPSAAGTFAVTLRAANAAGLGAESPLTITIAPAASAPVITSAAAATGQVGVAFSYQIVAAPGTITSYGASLVDIQKLNAVGLRLNSSTGLINGTPTTSGVLIISLAATASDGTGSLPQSLAITINPAAGAPVITSPGTATGAVGGNFTYNITATNTPTSFDAVNLPPGFTVNPNSGLIQGVPTTVGLTTASLVASNTAGTGAPRDLAITVLPATGAPVVTSSTLASAQAGTAFSFQITATNTPTSFEVLGAPAWMTINAATGALAGTPTGPGSITVQLVAGNSAGASSPRALTITIAAATGTPAITSTRTVAGVLGAALPSLQITATPAATSYFASGLPPGLSLNAATGVISGTPTLAGTFSATVSGSNASGVGAPVVVVFTITSPVTFGL